MSSFLAKNKKSKPSPISFHFLEKNPISLAFLQGMFVEAQNFGSFASGPSFAQMVPGSKGKTKIGESQNHQRTWHTLGSPLYP